MTADEIERFQRAWEFLVESGVLSKLAVGHADIDRQRHHSAQILGDYTGVIQPQSYADRFLCWHRAYVMDLELAMRAALVADHRARGLDCAAADQVFVPYFDGSSYPDWLREWMPNGTRTGIVTRHADERITLDSGHESNGLAISDSYEVVARSFEGVSQTCPSAPPSARLISEALARDRFRDFSTAIDTLPGLINDTPSPSLAATVRSAAEDIVDKDGLHQDVYDSFQTAANVIENGGWLSDSPAERFGVMAAFGALDRGPGFSDRGIQNWTETQYGEVSSAVNAYLQRAPHGVLHFYTAGESREANEKGLYGNSAYFQEAGADPHFYMLHCELDRYFATWIANHTDRPPLEGDDRIFKTWEDADEWTVDELMDPDSLPFAYDELWSPT